MKMHLKFFVLLSIILLSSSLFAMQKLNPNANACAIAQAASASAAAAATTAQTDFKRGAEPTASSAAPTQRVLTPAQQKVVNKLTTLFNMAFCKCKLSAKALITLPDDIVIEHILPAAGLNIRTYPVLQPKCNLQHAQRVNHAEFNHHGTRVVTASYDTTAKLWNAQTGALMHPLQHDRSVNQARIQS